MYTKGQKQEREEEYEQQLKYECNYEYKNTSSVEQNKRQDKIVICDDDKDIVRALEIYLSNRDYELLSAYTGREALDYVKKVTSHWFFWIS